MEGSSGGDLDKIRKAVRLTKQRLHASIKQSHTSEQDDSEHQAPGVNRLKSHGESFKIKPDLDKMLMKSSDSSALVNTSDKKVILLNDYDPTSSVSTKGMIRKETGGTSVSLQFNRELHQGLPTADKLDRSKQSKATEDMQTKPVDNSV